jgi:hypothetical protein
MNPRGTPTWELASQIASPFSKTLQVNLVVQLKVHIAWRASAERLGLAAHPAPTPTTRWRKSARPRLCEKRWRCEPRQQGSFWTFTRQNRRNRFCDAGGGGPELCAVGSLVLTAPAQGVIMAASALTPTMLQASTLIAISVEEVRCAHAAYENCSLTSRSTGWSNG